MHPPIWKICAVVRSCGMPPSGDRYWLDHCALPRPRPQGTEWDAFVSYRSIDRVWALALYDMLQQAKYKVFLDQYVLVAGSGVLSQLSENMRRSSSGVIVWSSRSPDSAWVTREVEAMVNRRDTQRNSQSPFYFVAAKLDGEPLPDLLAGSLFIDFSEYPDGPTGGELVRLTSGLQGAGLSPPAVERIAAFDAELREEPSELRSRVKSKDYDGILARALAETPAYTASATLPALAAQYLIGGGRNDDALKVIGQGQQRFRKSVRLRQLRGLALRRKGQIREALLELEKLRADGHQDPETLGILAAAWTASWQMSKDVDELERARDLYRSAFERTPNDTYVGINAASKSAMLGELDLARELAANVLARLNEANEKRGGPSDDYWELVTQPEALFLLGEFEKSLQLYHAARIASQSEAGSIGSTVSQLKLLLALPWVPPEWPPRFEQEFKKYW
jgi:hypothetical protein